MATPASQAQQLAQLLPDEASRKAFVEGQARLQGLARQLNNCRNEAFTRDRSSRMAQVTLKELQTIAKQPEVPNTFNAIGKIFVRMPVELIGEQMIAKAEKDRRELSVLVKTKEYLEKSIVDQERQLKELLDRRR